MRFLGRTAILAALLFALTALDVTEPGLNATALARPGWSLLSAGITAAALGWAIVRARARGWRLVGAIFLVHYGVAVLMTAVEATYLSMLRPLLAPLLVNGALTAGVFAPLAVALHGRFAAAPGARPAEGGSLAAGSLAWRIPLSGFVFVLLFVAGGALAFLPLARLLDPQALNGYANLALPAWVLPFQAVRAMAWVFLSLPMLRALDGGRRERGVVLGVLFASLMGSNLLVPTEMLPVGLQAAHLVEVAAVNFAFGFLTAGLVVQKDSS